MLQVLQGHSLSILRTLPDNHFHCVVTSPPYWGLRNYGIEPQVWGGNPDCAHEWGGLIVRERAGWEATPKNQKQFKSAETDAYRTESAFCSVCNAWRGSLGAEPTPELYVKNMIELFREVRRVLRSDGTLWLNLGDAYAASSTSNHSRGKARPAADGKGRPQNAPMFENPPRFKPSGDLKPKDLIGLPWMVAFALRSDGWWLRSDLIWHKPNAMPSSVKDRPTTAHEYMFLLTKSSRYFYDGGAVREKQTGNAHSRGRGITPKSAPAGSGIRTNPSFQKATSQWHEAPDRKRNLRSVWKIPTRPYKGAHFATFPSALVEPCILAGTSEKGCCAECGAPLERITREIKGTPESFKGSLFNKGKTGVNQTRCSDKPRTVAVKTIGWHPTCKHNAPVVPCRVLDPFGGSGTVAAVALTFNRAVTLIELNPEYIRLIYKRCNVTPVFPLAAAGD